jgi:pimeloyl-ACP methyl ester carboxylesterase
MCSSNHIQKQPIMKQNLLVLSLFLLTGTLQFTFAQSSAKPVYVIVHGAWGGSWAFKKADSLMTAKSAVVYRPSLTGQGERVHLASLEVGLTTHINDVVNMILYEDLHNVILIGHSYGGMVITGVADRVPERISKLIYLDAFVPEHGESVVSMQGARADWVMKMASNGYLVPAWVKPGQAPPKDVPHPLKTFTDTISLTNTKRLSLPVTYILTVAKGVDASTDDFALQAERAKKKGWPVVQMEADHNPQWSAVEALVELLLKVSR